MLVRAQIGYQVIGGTKFYERAEIKDAVAYLTFLVNPADGGAFTRIANSPKRGIGQTSLSRVLAHAETMGITPWEAAADAEDVPDARHRGAARRSAASCRRWSGCASASTARRAGRARCSRRRCARPATSTRSRPSGRSRRRAGSRTSRSSCSVAREYDAQPSTGEAAGVAEFLQQIALIADADTLARRRGPRDADDAPQREGARVPDRVHDRVRGRRLPAQPRARRGRRWRRSGGSPTWASRARCATSTSPTRAAATCSATQSFGVRSRFIDEIPRELTDQPDRNAVGAGRPAGLGRVASWAHRRRGVGRGPGRARRRRRGLPRRRRRRPRRVRRRRRHRGRAGRHRGRELRRRGPGAQADGRLRADPAALSTARCTERRAAGP